MKENDVREQGFKRLINGSICSQRTRYGGSVRRYFVSGFVMFRFKKWLPPVNWWLIQGRHGEQEVLASFCSSRVDAHHHQRRRIMSS